MKKFQFTPSNAQRGSVIDTLKIGGVKWEDNGTYTVGKMSWGPDIVMSGTRCADLPPRICNPYTNLRIALLPLYTDECNKMRGNSGMFNKKRLITAAVLVVAIASATFAQTSRATNADANRSWQSFWRQITAAINKKDHVALKKMMPNNFDDGGGGLTASEWLRFIDQNERKGSWRDLQKSFGQGTVVNKNWPSKGIPTRVTKDNSYYFEFRKDKKWYFAGVVGD